MRKPIPLGEEISGRPGRKFDYAAKGQDARAARSDRPGSRDHWREKRCIVPEPTEGGAGRILTP
jgi:hypothetical protein